jgi:hypothetical protein
LQTELWIGRFNIDLSSHFAPRLISGTPTQLGLFPNGDLLVAGDDQLEKLDSSVRTYPHSRLLESTPPGDMPTVGLIDVMP